MVVFEVGMGMLYALGMGAISTGVILGAFIVVGIFWLIWHFCF